MPHTGVMMRLLEMKGDQESTDEVVLQPGTVANWLRFPGTHVEHRALTDGATIEVSGGPPAGAPGQGHKDQLPKGQVRAVTNGEWHRLANESNHPLTVHVRLQPTWNPKRAHFHLNNRHFRGDEVWFEVKTQVGDTTARALYQLHDLSAGKGDVSSRLSPNSESIETFHHNATVTLNVTQGSGTVVLDGNPQQVNAGDSITVNPGQHYQLQNHTAAPFEVNQIHTPQWQPDDTFYVSNNAVIGGDQVWFEFVVPD